MAAIDCAAPTRLLMPVRPVPAALAILVLALSLGLAACGRDAGRTSGAEPQGATPIPSSQVEAPTPTPLPDLVAGPAMTEIRAALATTLAEKVVWINKHVTFEGSSEIPDDAAAFAGGQASLEETRRARLMVQFADVPEGLEASSMEVILDGSLVYLRGRVLDPYLELEGTWLLVDLESDDPKAQPYKALASGHNDASMALFYLYGATRVVGLTDDVVHEQPARRYSVEIDLDVALDTMPQAHRRGMEQSVAAMALAGVSRQLRAEVWIGADGLVHHIDYVQPLGPKLGGGEMRASVDFSDFGVPLTLDIPPEIHITPLEEVEEPREELPRA